MNRLLCFVLCACALPITASAHVLDQYLQVAQIALAPGGGRIALRLIPGVQVADRVFVLIDVDGDGHISSAEEQVYARRVLQDVTLEVDGRRAPLALTGVQFPSRREMNEGIGAIRLDLTVEAALGVAGAHQLSFRNDHLPALGVYLVNALVPTTSAITISGQARDPLQREIRLSFHITPTATHRPRPWTGVLMICLLLVLLFLPWQHLRQYVHRCHDAQIQAKKTRCHQLAWYKLKPLILAGLSYNSSNDSTWCTRQGETGKQRCELLVPSETPWAITQADGRWKFLVPPDRIFGSQDESDEKMVKGSQWAP